MRTPEPLVLPFRHGPFRNVSYALACPETRRALLVDPAWEVATMLAALANDGLELEAIVLTHGHHDHVHGVADVAAATGAAVYAHADESLGELRTAYGGPVTALSGGEVLEVGRLAVTLLHTPGHTAGSLSALCGGRLFSGDTMMSGGMGRPGPGIESVEAMWQSVRTVFAPLDGGVVVHPGHDSGPTPTATMASQRAHIPALRAETFDEFVSAMERETGRILRALFQ